MCAQALGAALGLYWRSVGIGETLSSGAQQKQRSLGHCKRQRVGMLRVKGFADGNSQILERAEEQIRWLKTIVWRLYSCSCD